MTDSEYEPVAVSRRICAPAREIFQILANPVRHLDLDGSQMLRGAVTTSMLTGVGDARTLERLDALCTSRDAHPNTEGLLP